MALRRISFRTRVHNQRHGLFAFILAGMGHGVLTTSLAAAMSGLGVLWLWGLRVCFVCVDHRVYSGIVGRHCGQASWAGIIICCVQRQPEVRCV